MQSNSIGATASVCKWLENSMMGLRAAASARLHIAYRVVRGVPFRERLARIVTAVIADDMSNFHNSQPIIHDCVKAPRFKSNQ